MKWYESQRKPTTTGDRCGSTPGACSPAGSGRFSDHEFSNLNDLSMIGYATSGTTHWWKTHILGWVVTIAALLLLILRILRVI